MSLLTFDLPPGLVLRAQSVTPGEWPWSHFEFETAEGRSIKITIPTMEPSQDDVDGMMAVLRVWLED